jgi:hypothetical protein
MGFLHLSDPDHSSGLASGLLVSPRTGPRITAGSPVFFGRPHHPTEVAQDLTLGADTSVIFPASFSLFFGKRKKDRKKTMSKL